MSYTVRVLSEPLTPLLLTLFWFIRFVDDILFPTIDGFDFRQHFYDTRDEGGGDGLYPTDLPGPAGTHIHMPLALELASTGTEVNFLDISIMVNVTEPCGDFTSGAPPGFPWAKGPKGRLGRGTPDDRVSGRS